MSDAIVLFGDNLRRLSSIEGDLGLVEFGLDDAIQGLHRAETIGNLRAIAAAFGPSALLVEALVPPGAR